MKIRLLQKYLLKIMENFLVLYLVLPLKKLKTYLEIGNKLHINYNFKNEGRIGYFKVEILDAITPLYFDNRKKLLCITSAMNLIKIGNCGSTRIIPISIT